jgi:hypothetical protein
VRSIFALVVVALLASCSSTSTQPPQEPAPAPPQQPGQPTPNPPVEEPPAPPSGDVPLSPSSLYIFAGLNNEVFLGCLSCPAGDPNSVHAQYGLYGGEYSATSIFNDYGQYGSPYAVYSACNPYTQTPPVVVDGEGNYYGRLTVNTYHPDAISSQYDWLTTVVCV